MAPAVMLEARAATEMYVPERTLAERLLIIPTEIEYRALVFETLNGIETV